MAGGFLRLTYNKEKRLLTLPARRLARTKPSDISKIDSLAAKTRFFAPPRKYAPRQESMHARCIKNLERDGAGLGRREPVCGCVDTTGAPSAFDGVSVEGRIPAHSADGVGDAWR